MPSCRVCKRHVSILNWDIFGRGCANCVGIDASKYETILEDPCPQCESSDIYARVAPAFAFTVVNAVPYPYSVPTDLFMIGCASCGCVHFKFSRETAAALPRTPGWHGREHLRKRE